MRIEMKTMKTQTLPAELVASSLFLLKRLGMTAKQRSVDEYERLGLNPYHHAILALLEGRAPLRPRDARRSPRRARRAEARRAQARSRRPPTAARSHHRRRQADAREAPRTGPAAGGRVPRAARRGTA